MRALIDGAEWIDGNATSGTQSALAKRNRQLPEESDAAKRAGSIILDALAATPLFVAAALPLKVFPPLFNRYEGGEAFGAHVDGAVRIRSEEHTSELQSLMRISYAVFCLKKKKQ